MKKILIISVMIVAVTAGYGIAQMGGGMMGGGQQQQNPYQYQQQYPYQGGPGMMGGYGMGPGMMGGYGMGPGMMGGYGMGPGMMGGYGMGPGMMGGYQQYPYQRSPGMGYGRGPWYDPEKYQKFLDDTTKLRKKLNEKQFEYFEAMRNPDTKRETISKLAREIQELQKKIYEKAPR
jgi:hypothetical protein